MMAVNYELFHELDEDLSKVLDLYRLAVSVTAVEKYWQAYESSGGYSLQEAWLAYIAEIEPELYPLLQRSQQAVRANASSRD